MAPSQFEAKRYKGRQTQRSAATLPRATSRALMCICQRDYALCSSSTGFITMATGIVLTVAPTLIPSAVGIHLEPSANVLAYLLAGAEFSGLLFSRLEAVA